MFHRIVLRAQCLCFPCILIAQKMASALMRLVCCPVLALEQVFGGADSVACPALSCIWRWKFQVAVLMDRSPLKPTSGPLAGGGSGAEQGLSVLTVLSGGISVPRPSHGGF